MKREPTYIDTTTMNLYRVQALAELTPSYRIRTIKAGLESRGTVNLVGVELKRGPWYWPFRRWVDNGDYRKLNTRASGPPPALRPIDPKLALVVADTLDELDGYDPGPPSTEIDVDKERSLMMAELLQQKRGDEA